MTPGHLIAGQGLRPPQAGPPTRDARAAGRHGMTAVDSVWTPKEGGLRNS
jgi:hypothetical protein